MNITVSSFQLPDWRWGGSIGKLRLYASKPFTDSLGVPHLAGTVGSKTGFYQEIALTISGSTITVPTFTTYSTTDARPGGDDVKITGVLFDSKGVKRDTLFSGWRIPETPTSTTWPTLETFNRANPRINKPENVLSDIETAALAQSIAGTLNDASDAIKGRTKLSVAPISASNPVAVGDNDPRLLLLTSAGMFDANTAPYSLVADIIANDSTTGFQACLDAAFAWSQANNKPAEMLLDNGQYWIKGALQTAGGYRAQIKWPLASPTNPASVVIRPKGNGRFIQPFWESGASSAGVLLTTTLTAQSYTAAGWPSMIGGIDPINGEDASTQVSYCAAHLQGIAFKHPANPSVASYDFRNLNAAIVEDKLCFSEPSGTFPATFTEPTNPTGVAGLMPGNNRDVSDYVGRTWILGMYGGLGVSELTHTYGQVHLVHNKVALHVQTWHPTAALQGWYHRGLLGLVYAVRENYVIAAINPATGVVAPTSNLAGTFRTHIQINALSIEDDDAGWAMPIAHIYDPESRLTGDITYGRVIRNTGNTSGLIQPAHYARNLVLTDIALPRFDADVIYDSLFGQAGKVLTTYRPQINQGSTWELPGVSAPETYFSFVHAAGGNSIVSGAGIHHNVIESNISDGVVSAVARFNSLANGSMGMSFRYVDKDQFWFVEWIASTGVATVYEKTGAGAYTSRGTTTIAPTAFKFYTVAVVLSGTSIKVYIDGIQVGGDITSASYQTATKHGIYSGTNSNMAIGNFRVTAVP